ncbi:class I SAM-dependent methyltransferase [Mycobacterium hubeiense]|uniref:class I SAM-dependent methyltransferase n=1 Tax=Mycobacterium hubeiense TaxID=1867256 RepID=UPI000C7EAC85|nr:class I SAM-dependent methyltransferase [Mycobacterium sp. QGD 101]
MAGSPEYWNHNTAYHPWLLRIAATHRGDVLDVGCGDGLLAQRLAAVSRSVTGIDSDAAAIERARNRLADQANVTVSHENFHAFDAGARRYDLITFVATLHHMDLRAALSKARDLLTPTGEIAVVGLATNKSVWDWAWAVACVPPARIGSWLHGETRDVGGAVANPREGLGEIRRTVAEVLSGASVRRALYYRYLLRWTNS